MYERITSKETSFMRSTLHIDEVDTGLISNTLNEMWLGNLNNKALDNLKEYFVKKKRVKERLYKRWEKQKEKTEALMCSEL